jgi:hypothetical protein
MLEKVATHDNMDVAELFSPVDKCARAVLGEPEAHRVTSAPAKHPVVMMAVPVRPCTTPCTTVLESAGKSRSSQNSTMTS